MRNLTIAVLAAFICCASLNAQDIFADKRSTWADKAESSKPALVKKIYRPLFLVEPVADSLAYQGWKMSKTEDMSSYYGISLKQRPCVTVDFGRHMTGHYTFKLKDLYRVQDAPIRMKFTFGEVPAEMAIPFDPFPGDLSRAWMQDETVTIERTDLEITIPRRISGRYMRIELLGGPRDFDFAMEDMYFTAVSSAGELKAPKLQNGTPEMIRRINDVSLETLRECMQTVYEDGPKRDHRLWVGDLYLESLANRWSFRNFDLTKRCLYLFASLTTDDGLIISNVFEHPYPHPQVDSYMLNYSLLFNTTLLEYLKDTGDLETAQDLWVVAKRQIEDALSYVDKDYIFDRTRKDVWLFFDWREGLDENTPIQAAVIFALDQTCELARMLGRQDEVKDWKSIRNKMASAALKHMYDKQKGVFFSGKDRQVSVIAQTWMIKAGVIKGQDAQKAIKTVLADKGTVMPGTPYGTHYLIDAMLLCGMNNEAKEYLLHYWGGMVKKGADTFWEAYDPEDDLISPYHFHPLNSYCHAWSCTPTYFIYAYPEIFQTGHFVDSDTILPKSNGQFSLMQVSSSSDDIGNCYILRTRNGKVIVIDGGKNTDTQNLRNILTDKYGGIVDQWWISHPHGDHIGAFIEILENPQGIKIKEVYHSRFSESHGRLENNQWEKYVSKMYRLLDNATDIDVYDLQTTGSLVKLDDIYIKVLGVSNQEIRNNPYNNSSMILRIWDKNKSVLFLGDAHEECGKLAMERWKDCKEVFDADYVQLAHHGQDGVSEDFYKNINFKYCLWSTPTWVFNPDSAKHPWLETEQTKTWMHEKGIHENRWIVSCLDKDRTIE